MTLIKDGAVSDDEWADVSQDESADAVVHDGPLIVSLDQWKQSRSLLVRRNPPLGIRLRSDQPPERIADDLERFDVVVLEFPKLQDGRAFSYARLLRERYGYKGEIRAVGDVFQDQIYFMQRCGFTSYVLPEGRSPEGAIGALKSYSVAYQPAADDTLAAMQQRLFKRKS